MRLEFWTRFLSFFQNLTLSYLHDFVADVGKRVGNCVGESVENWVDFDENWVDESDENWVDEFEQHIDVKTVVLAAQSQTDSKKN